VVIPFVSIWPNLYTPVPEYRSQQYLKWFELPEIYHISVEVMEIRDATTEELKHGHVHGEGGHHH